MQHAHNIVGIAFPHRHAGVRAVQHFRDQFLETLPAIEGFHFGAVDHDVGDFEVLQIQYATQHIAVILDEGFFLVVKRYGTPQFVMRRQDACIILDVDAKKPERVPDDEFHRQNNGTQNGGDDAHNGCHGKRHAFRISDGIGFRQHFGEDQNDDGHDARGNDGSTVAKDFDERCCGDRRGCDVGEVVAEQQ